MSADGCLSEKELKHQKDMQLKDLPKEVADAVKKIRRELKKKGDGWKKLLKSYNALKPEQQAERTALQGELDMMRNEILAMEAEDSQLIEEAGMKPIGGSIIATDAVPAAASASPAAEAASAAPAAPEPNAEAALETLRAELEQFAIACIQEQRTTSRIGNQMPLADVVHPRVAEVGIMMGSMTIVGGNARMMAMMSAFRELLKSTTVLDCNMMEVDRVALEELLRVNYEFLHRQREATSGMSYVKHVLTNRLVHAHNIATTASNPNAREAALQILSDIEYELSVALRTIALDRSLPYVTSSDTILVFGRSSAVEFILLSRAAAGDASRRPERVIVIDSAPLFEGRDLATKVAAAGIPVTYGLITSCCTLMPKCTRVFIGASSVLQNGDVSSRCGTALVAACAKAFAKPVLCVCESYKFQGEVWSQNSKLMDMRVQRGRAPVNDLSARTPLGFSSAGSPNISVVTTPYPQTGVVGGALSSPLYNNGPNFASPSTARSPSAGNLSPCATNAGFGVSTMEEVFAGVEAAATPSPVPKSSGYLYDLTPAKYVDMIVCEMGCLHTSAIIAAIKMREKMEEMF